MRKIFNTTGPCQSDRHYMLPALARCQAVSWLIEEAEYFVLHAARQSGKTTLLLDLAQQVNEAGDYYALYCSLETVQGIHDVEQGIPAIVRELKSQLRYAPLLKNFVFDSPVADEETNTLLRLSLSAFCVVLDKPLVIFFDEIDCLSNGTLISFLRQLRLGYINRAQVPFVHSIALVGMRNIRDYKANLRDDADTLGSASPFNIVAETLTLRNFTEAEITELYAQHTQVTGQIFSSELVAEVFRYTQGQPWLVNALAREMTQKILARDYALTPQLAHVEQAVQNIIQRRDTHIDSLMERLKEARVQRVIEPVIMGGENGYDLLNDDYQYVFDLGLIREDNHRLVPANPVYEDVIVRYLSFRSRGALESVSFLSAPPAYVRSGRLDMRYLLEDFQRFWRQHSESWIARFQYQEAAPHLILHAFFYRVINGGGRISREMAAGNGRLDLCLHYQAVDYPVELKIRYSEETYAEGQQQLLAYMDKLGCDEGWLVVFDRRKSVDWADKLFWQTHETAGKLLHIVGC